MALSADYSQSKFVITIQLFHNVQLSYQRYTIEWKVPIWLMFAWIDDWFKHKSEFLGKSIFQIVLREISVNHSTWDSLIIFPTALYTTPIFHLQKDVWSWCERGLFDSLASKSPTLTFNRQKLQNSFFFQYIQYRSWGSGRSEEQSDYWTSAVRAAEVPQRILDKQQSHILVFSSS